MEQITHHPENTTPPPIDTLSSDECWVLLESESFGRLAVAAAGEIEIFPVNYAAYDGALYIRTAAGTKLAAVTISDRVAFEVDRIAAPGARSVVVKGRAEVLESADDIAAAEEAGLRPWVASTKSRHIRIRPTEVTGRSLRFGPEPEAEPDVTC
ncbi:pyridoxamine 5'-phosphate oxidase family protein [Brevibacterium gallinarum]|uniref:Pyridoxamine 5'-phosphate oxidase family protein n=1 Tax=Brevibacterium gallinarum TaxID=2762220 RepID=A0ABR8WQH7_9MICO|nr:pyridoxamine 5'-phosphate oxidase family protein [Brevibacterium gallinarum]MBD8019245.1 pyridoxamine 5'-phosphate oxidase family protein [Brevibacterium gallinarum]